MINRLCSEIFFELKVVYTNKKVMPIVNFKGSALSVEQRKELIQKFTEITNQVTHAPEQFISVVIEEYSDDNLGVAGKTVTEIKQQVKK
jgi:4-oxalocrotonate tautomerase